MASSDCVVLASYSHMKHTWSSRLFLSSSHSLLDLQETDQEVITFMHQWINHYRLRNITKRIRKEVMMEPHGMRLTETPGRLKKQTPSHMKTLPSSLKVSVVMFIYLFVFVQWEIRTVNRPQLVQINVKNNVYQTAIIAMNFIRSNLLFFVPAWEFDFLGPAIKKRHIDQEGEF